MAFLTVHTKTLENAYMTWCDVLVNLCMPQRAEPAVFVLFRTIQKRNVKSLKRWYQPSLKPWGNLLTVEGEAVLFAWFCFTSSYVNLQQVIFLPKALVPDWYYGKFWGDAN